MSTPPARHTVRVFAMVQNNGGDTLAFWITASGEFGAALNGRFVDAPTSRKHLLESFQRAIELWQPATVPTQPTGRPGGF